MINKATNSLVSNMPQTVTIVNKTMSIVGRLGRTPVIAFTVDLISFPHDKRSRIKILKEKNVNEIKTDKLPLDLLAQSQLLAFEEITQKNK